MNKVEDLKEDFQQTVNFIYKCDEHIFKIKNWALITSSAVIAFSVSQSKDELVFTNLVLLAGFIYLELIYKSFQDTAIEHCNDLSERIDGFLAGNEVENISDGYKHSYGRKLVYPAVTHVFSLLKNRNRWHILNFYALLAVFSVGAYFVSKYLA